MFERKVFTNTSVAQLVSARSYTAGGHEFDPHFF